MEIRVSYPTLDMMLHFLVFRDIPQINLPYLKKCLYTWDSLERLREREGMSIYSLCGEPTMCVHTK